MSQDLFNNWDYIDLIKVIFSLLSGIILGTEREMKDKAAGLKTITIITLGSTLFSMLSYQIGLLTDKDSTRIASYVVSGIGFLGAGVIFKDKYNVHGLTTASIIWVAAAIGMAIGFGEFVLASMFLGVNIVVIYLGNFINKKLFNKKFNKSLSVIISNNNEDLAYLNNIISKYSIVAHYKHYHKENNTIKIHIDLTLNDVKMNQLLFEMNISPIIISYTL